MHRGRRRISAAAGYSDDYHCFFVVDDGCRCGFFMVLHGPDRAPMRPRDYAPSSGALFTVDASFCGMPRVGRVS